MRLSAVLKLKKKKKVVDIETLVLQLRKKMKVYNSFLSTHACQKIKIKM